MTLTFKYDLDIINGYHHTKFGVSQTVLEI